MDVSITLHHHPSSCAGIFLPSTHRHPLPNTVNHYPQVMKTVTFYLIFITVLWNGGSASYLLEVSEAGGGRRGEAE
mgnify:CR=1 FL=1